MTIDVEKKEQKADNKSNFYASEIVFLVFHLICVLCSDYHRCHLNTSPAPLQKKSADQMAN